MDAPKVISFCRGFPMMLCCVDTWAGQRNAALVKLRFDSWEFGMASNRPVKWVSPWITLGRKDIQKSGFDVYFTPEVKKPSELTGQWWEPGVRNVDEDLPSVFTNEEFAGKVTFKFSIQTEKKTKSKTYTMQTLSDADTLAGKLPKQKRLHFGGSGRRFRLIIETVENEEKRTKHTPWRLVGGIHIISEIDKD